MEAMPAVKRGASEIADFYAGKSVLVTGATGFLGKVLLEKLLRSCPDVETVYILMRSKKEQNIIERTDKLFTEEVFQKLDKAALARVVPINGDINELNLGLNEMDRKTLRNKVDVVIHSAACVRFEDPLKPTLITNLRGTAEVVQLCKEIEKLQSFVYVSTAYSNCYNKDIEEKTYETSIEPSQLINCVKWMSEEQMEALAPHLNTKWPNTYAFTKAMAENYVKEHCVDMPAAIFRPSIVVSAAYEPLPGWNDNLNGPSGIVAGSAMGIIRSMNVDMSGTADFVPVDMVANAIIATAKQTAEKKKALTVYNYTSGSRNPLIWNKFLDTTYEIGITAPPSKALWYFCLLTIKSFRLHRLAVFLLHTLPAVLLDTLALLLGKKRRVYKLYQKIDKLTAAPAFFTTHSWNFTDKNVVNAFETMSPTDKEIFKFDLAKLSWESYMRDYYMGMRQYILKDEVSTIPAAKKRYERLRYLHRGLQVVLGIGFLGLIMKLVTFTIWTFSSLTAQHVEM